MTNPEELIRLAHAMEKPLERWLKWKSIVDRYERGKSSKLATIVNRLRPTVEKPSQALLESLAYGDPEYQKYLDEWGEAERHAIKARVKYDNLRCCWESTQSVIAWEREGMKRGVVG